MKVPLKTYYLKETERQLSDEKTCEEIKITEKDQVGVVEKSNNLFSNLRRKNVITENVNNYFRFNFKKATNLGKLYLLPKILHKGLCKVPGRPVICNCGTPSDKVSKFLDHHLQAIMKQGESYIRDTGNFLAKLKAAGEVPKGAILVTADVVGLYPSISDSEGLDILKKQYENYPNKRVSTEDIGKMADFAFKNNLLEFDSKFYKQISGKAIGTKFAPPYACIFMYHIETEFLKTQDIKPWFWKRFIDDIFFIWTESEESLEKFLEDLNKFHPDLKFTYEKSKEKVSFLDVVIKIKEGRLITDLYCKPTDGHQSLHYDSCHADHIKRSIIFSQKLRLKRICSEKNDLNVHVEDLKIWFRKRGYSDYLIKEQVERALSVTPSDENDSKKVNGASFVVTYNSVLKNLS